MLLDRKNKLVIVSALFICCSFIFRNAFCNALSDTIQLRINIEQGKNLFKENPDSSFVLWQKGLKICQDNIGKNNNQEFFMQKSASLYRAIGTYYQTKQNFNRALNNFQQSLQISIQINYTEIIYKCYKSLGSLFENISDPNCKLKSDVCLRQSQLKAENFYRKGLALTIKNNNQSETASFYKLIAYIKINLNLPDSASAYFNKAITIQKSLKENESLLSTYNDLIYVYQVNSDIANAIATWKKYIITAKELKDPSSIAIAYFNLGALFFDKGNIPLALDNYYNALKIREEIKDNNGVATLYNVLGILYKSQNDLKKAYDFHDKALKKYQNLNDKQGIAYTLNNIGNIYDEFGEKDCKGNHKDCLYKGQLKALDFYKKSVVLLEEINDTKGIAYALNNIGSIYSQIGDPDCKPNGSKNCILNGQKLALPYLLKGLKLKEELGDKQGTAYSLNNIGEVYSKMGNNSLAAQYLNKSLELAKELGFPENIRNSSELLYLLYKKQNNYFEALQMHELFISMRDSLNNLSTQKESVKKEFQYQYEKKAAADSIKNEHEQSIKNAQIDAQKAKLKQEQTLRYTLYGGLFLMILFAGFIFNRFKVTQKQKRIIEQQKGEVENQKREVEKQHEIAESRRIIAEEQKEVIEKQKHEVEEKQKEITDSIHYASRIQRAMLTSNTYITNVLGEQGSEHFLFYQPKDIVSGDFYWALSIPPVPGWDLHTNDTKFKNNETQSDLFYLCTADCTGHGVPGAFMSLLNIGFLNAVILEKYIKLPHEILDHQRNEIIKALNPTGTENSKDGMDCVLYCIDYNKMLLHIAAANNPLWLIRKMEEGEHLNEEEKIETFNQYKLLEFKPNKMPVGLSGQEEKKFKGDIVEIKRGDIIYTFTDGFADQFGGEKGKKFMYKPFKQLLLANCEKSMELQQEILKNTINNWMNKVDQIDDILVIGVKI
jgi:tetratricopeptide (TPR) repeat protein